MTMSSFQLILLSGDTSTVPSGADHGHPISAHTEHPITAPTNPQPITISDRVMRPQSGPTWPQQFAGSRARNARYCTGLSVGLPVATGDRYVPYASGSSGFVRPEIWAASAQENAGYRVRLLC